MKTYLTYQEAKIANPECDIYELDGRFETKQMIDQYNFCRSSFKLCNPVCYCVTVEQFLNDGYKFGDGDIVLTCKNNVAELGVDGYECVNFNIKHQNNDKTYILRAAALDLAAIAKQNVEYYSKQISDTAREAFSTNSIPKLKRTKVEFVKVEDSIWHLETDFRCGELYNNSLDCSGDFVVISSETVFLACAAAGNLYRRVETPMTEREAFIDEAMRFTSFNTQQLLGQMFDSGKFKLVN